MACGDDDSPPEPDRVVNIERDCEWFKGNVWQDAPQSLCDKIFSGERQDDDLSRARLQLTVRTPQGTTYTIRVHGATKVALNEPWPPE